ncbi:MAG: hypothetical protein ACQEVT_18415 [Pseudomonadota bacterium]
MHAASADYKGSHWPRLILRLIGIDAWHIFERSLHDELRACKENIQRSLDSESAENPTHIELRVWLGIHRSDILSAIGELESASKVLWDAFHFYNSYPQVDTGAFKVMILGRAGALERERGKPDRAADLLDQAAKAAAGLLEAQEIMPLVKASIDLNLSRIAIESGELDFAESTLKNIIESLEEGSVDQDAISMVITSECQIALAEILLQTGEPQIAVNQLQAARLIVQRLTEMGFPGAGSKYLRALGKLGSALLSINDFAGARFSFELAREVFSESKENLKKQLAAPLDTSFEFTEVRSFSDLQSHFPTSSERLELQRNCEIIFIGRFGVEFAKLLMRLCVFHLKCSKPRLALASADEAISIVCKEPFRKRADLAPLRAVLAMYRGISLRHMKKFKDSVTCLQRAKINLEGELEKTSGEKIPCRAGAKESSKNPELDGLRGRILSNLGVSCAEFGLIDLSLEAFTSACELYEGDTIGPWRSQNVERCRLYSNMSYNLRHIPAPHLWARGKSRRLSEMLELAPPEATGPWSEMRVLFRTFHERWLRFAVRNGDVEIVPEILAALQGRDVAADVLDRLAQEAADDAGTDPALKVYQAARTELRRLAESIRDDGAEAFGFDVGRADEALGAESPTGPRNTRKAKLLKEYQALHDRLPALRDAAAAVPGFEVLRSPHLEVTQTWLRESLSPDEVMLLAFIQDGVARTAVLRGDGGGKLCDLWTAVDRVKDMERFSQSLTGRSGLRDGGWASGSTDTKKRPSSNRMTDAELAAFWETTGEAQRAQLWAPLTEALAGAKRVIGITHGRLQLAALSAGAPANAEIVQYPGLAFYALARGLYGDRTEPAKPAAPCISIVRGDHADLQYSPLEEQASVALWRSAGAEVSHPDYPREGRVGLLHVTSHGDLLDDGSPVILLGSDRTISERDILRGPPIEAAFLNLCLGGRLSEDPLDGSPSGLVSALMRRGAKVVVAALPPVDDLWACVLGLMVTEAMAKEGLPLDRALAIAKRQLGDGVPAGVIAPLKDWYMARLDHVVREHAYSHRRNPEACARAALKAALGNDEDAASLAELVAIVPERERPATAKLLIEEPAWTAFEAHLAKGPGPAEHGALVHGMIAFGESAPTS